jgi:predicted ATPase
METITFHPDVTFFAGENGTGKSTLPEAIAVLCGLNAKGGSKNFRFSTRASVVHRRVAQGAATRREPGQRKGSSAMASFPKIARIRPFPASFFFAGSFSFMKAL